MNNWGAVYSLLARCTLLCTQMMCCLTTEMETDGLFVHADCLYRPQCLINAPDTLLKVDWWAYGTLWYILTYPHLGYSAVLQYAASWCIKDFSNPLWSTVFTVSMMQPCVLCGLLAYYEVCLKWGCWGVSRWLQVAVMCSTLLLASIQSWSFVCYESHLEGFTSLMLCFRKYTHNYIWMHYTTLWTFP